MQTITSALGSTSTAFPELTVKAFDRDMRSGEPLGDAKTDACGYYEIFYTADQFRRAEKGTADLIVRAYDAQGEIMGAFDTLFDAPLVATIDLVITTRQTIPLSEYEELLKQLTPLMEGVAPADLTEQDVAFLTAETGVNPERLQFLRQSSQLSRQTELPTEAFYGWARQNLVTLDATRLLATRR
jgi:hypothetical protein